MTTMISTLKSLAKYRNSYRAGILQSKAFRILKKRTNEALAPYDLNATDWGILGLLNDSPNGLQQKQIATEIGVKAPFVTRSIKILTARKFITLVQHPEDTRIKIATIAKPGKAFVDKTEPKVLATLMHAFDKAGNRNLVGYLLTLIAVVDQHNAGIIEDIDLDHMTDEA